MQAFNGAFDSSTDAVETARLQSELAAHQRVRAAHLEAAQATEAASAEADEEPPPYEPPVRLSRLSMSRVEWLPDGAEQACNVCKTQFSRLFNRRHHCRACGHNVCGKCSTARLMVPGYNQAERACDLCATQQQPPSSLEQPIQQPQPAPQQPMDEPACCVVCMDGAADTLLLHEGEMGHMCCCKDCAKLLKDRKDPCPICRADVISIVLVH